MGAGPGAPDLLTLRAASRLRDADLILRDILVPDALLASIGTRAEIIEVGRRCGSSQTQADRLEHIHDLMITAYRAGRKVVRLKSGDPLIFARAVEETAKLIEEGIPFEFVPGVTAGLAAASLAKIPLTERGTASSVFFCTGQTAGTPNEDVESWAALLRGGSTLVLYMGLKALARIAPKLSVLVPTDQVHVSAVSGASLPHQHVVSGTLADIEGKLAAVDLPSPVLLLIGQHAVPMDPALLLRA